ncbi:MAG TPA: PAS domain-containing sensor histidine kinase, partial [Candidatus Obscuribacterales bacterium]
ETMIRLNLTAIGIGEALFSVARSQGERPEEQHARFDKARTKVDEAASFIVWLWDRRTDRESILKAQTLLNRARAVLDKHERLASLPKETSTHDLSVPLAKETLTLLNETQTSIRSLVEQEEKVQVESPQIRNKLEWLVGLVVLFFLLFDIGIALWLVRSFSSDIVDRLSKAALNAQSLATEKPVEGIGGNDEIAALDRSIAHASEILAEAHKRNRAILDLASEAVFSLDQNLRVHSAGPSTEKLFLYTAEDLLGLSILELLADDEKKAFRAAVEDVQKSGSSPSIETVIVRKNGSLGDFRISMRKGESNIIVCVASDISERKNVERMRQQFVSMISHDLRTPLTSVGGALSLVSVGAKGNVPASVKGKLKGMERTVQKLTRTVQDILDIERLESGKLQMRSDYISAFDLMEDAIEEVLTEAQDKDLSLVKKYRDAAILGDYDWLRQALVNLLRYLISQASTGTELLISSVSFDVLAEIRFAPGDGNLDAVEPSFHRSYLAKDGQAPVRSDMHLSLALAKTVIEGQGGEIGAEMLPEGRSYFFVRIPRVVEEVSSHD